MFWSEDKGEYVGELIRSDYSAQTIEEFLDSVFFGAYEAMYAPTDATHLLLVYSDSDYQFTPNDLGWLEYATLVLSYKATLENECVFFLKVECSIEDYYLVCAAIIKVLNRAFPGFNIFLFKIEDFLAIGSGREFSTNSDFALSGLLSEEGNEEYDGFFDMIWSADIKDIPGIIISFSPQEKEDYLDIEKEKLEPDYLSVLSEIQSEYGIDTSKERQRCFSMGNKNKVVDSHEQVKKQLVGVADSDDFSSYEVLLAAEKAEKDSQKIQLLQDDHALHEDIKTNYSEEAFENAEQMLKEMLGERDNKQED